MWDPQSRIERYLAGIRMRDPRLAEELDALPARTGSKATVEALAPVMEGLAADTLALASAAHQYRVARPVLTVVGDDLDVVTSDAESMIWQERLKGAGERVLRAISAVGRIEVEGHGDAAWVGTGFMIRDDVIATNQHVAQEFAESVDGDLVFKLNLGGDQMSASMDFLEEEGRSESLVFPIVEVLHLELDGMPDVAFLQVGPVDEQVLPAPLAFFAGEVQPDRLVAAIGYPARDSRAKHAELMHRIFGNIYDKKRVSPGQVLRVENGHVVHDCSVLRGNSGSPLIDLETGEVVGIHSVGEFMADNFAVQASLADAALRNG